MKLTDTHRDMLRDLILNNHDIGELEEIAVRYRENGLTPKRFRWDAVYKIRWARRAEFFDAVYVYADDAHIDTALRALMRELGLEWAATN